MRIELTEAQGALIVGILLRYVGWVNSWLSQIQSQCPPSAERARLVKSLLADRAAAEKLRALVMEAE